MGCSSEALHFANYTQNTHIPAEIQRKYHITVFIMYLDFNLGYIYIDDKKKQPTGCN